MPDFSTLVVFMVASFVLIVSPGPAVMYIVTRSIDQGRRTGLVSVLGIGTGAMMQVIIATLGLSALLVSSSLAFYLIKYLGAAYLIYLGIRKLLEKQAPLDVSIEAKPRNLWRAFYQGVIVNLFNPKVALFFMVFLPQFADPARGSIGGQFLLLGTIFVVIGILSDSMYALLAGTIRHWLKGSVAFLRGQRYFAGSMYVALGVTTALSGTHRNP